MVEFDARPIFRDNLIFEMDGAGIVVTNNVRGGERGGGQINMLKRPIFSLFSCLFACIFSSSFILLFKSRRQIALFFCIGLLILKHFLTSQGMGSFLRNDIARCIGPCVATSFDAEPTFLENKIHGGKSIGEAPKVRR
jgi:hypothetical protein